MRTVLACLIAQAMLLAAPAGACPIPVYQYSLEWWERDPYEVYVFDHGVLTDPQQAAIDRLQRISQQEVKAEPANLQLRRVKSDSEDRLRAHSALQGEVPESLPWLVVYYPAVSANRRTPVWSGELSPENIDTLLDSPARQTISEMLLNRISVVWVLLESGNARADNQAATVLEKEVQRLEQTLVAPDPAGWGAEDILISDIRFATLRISRSDAAEKMLIAMLVKSEIDSHLYVDQPMVFPIFGRGLIMNALIGRGINAPMIRRTAEFLTGPCSCTVKSINPGTDLLTSVDWAARIKPMSVRVGAEPGGLGRFLDNIRNAEEK